MGASGGDDSGESLAGLDDVGIPGRLSYLRPVDRTDAPLLRFLMNDPTVTETLVGFNVPVSSGDQLRWIDTPRNSLNGPWHFTIVERETDRAVGLATAHDVDWRNGTVKHGIKLHPGAQGRGIAYDAIMARIAWTFFVAGLRRIDTAVLDFNHASLRLHHRIGYSLEGRRREAVLRDGRWCDLLLFGLLRSEAEQMPGMMEYRRLVSPVGTAQHVDTR